MQDTRPPELPGDADWLAATRNYAQQQGDELELAELRAGDRLQVHTRNTIYRFEWIGGAKVAAMLATNREDRPSGEVVLVGCALGAGSTIAPGRLFTGGSMEYSSQQGELVHRTTPITALYRVRHLMP